VLDLNVNDDATPAGNKGALALPRLNLASETMKLNNNTTTPKDGMLVYHTGNTLDGSGIYTWTGGTSGQWVKMVAGRLKITVQPKAFSWSRLKHTVGDPNGPATATIAPLSVSATGAGTIKYQWYEVPQIVNAPDTIITDGASASYSPVSTAWGMRSYYCEVSNGFDTIRSNIAQVAIGCGAKTNDNRWLRFMCYNVGASAPAANIVLDSIKFAFSGKGANSADTISSDAKGWWFQWGRRADGHQWRSSTAKSGPVTLANATNTDGSKNFITNSTVPYDWRTPQYDYLWRNWYDSIRSPCPSGWRIPSSSEWGSIYRGGGSYGTPDDATSNTWIWINNVVAGTNDIITGTRGYAIKPNGTTTLFLPAAGFRSDASVLLDVGSAGFYWSGTSTSNGASFLMFSGSRVSPDLGGYRVDGFSVRCLAE
jgi:uncharacterized protein (TIGR02145 family)